MKYLVCSDGSEPSTKALIHVGKIFKPDDSILLKVYFTKPIVYTQTGFIDLFDPAASKEALEKMKENAAKAFEEGKKKLIEIGVF